MNPPPRVPLIALMLLTAGTAHAAESTTPREGAALAEGRLELRPDVGWALFPSSVSGPFVGAGVGFRLSQVVALGMDAAWYAPFNRTPGSAPTDRLNEARDSINLDVTIAPWAARRVGALEPYLIAGLGAVQTRPIAVVDPVHRSFDYNTLVNLGLGAGMRFFVEEPIAISLELRDLLYFEKMENEQILMSPPGQATAVNEANPAGWYDPKTHFAHALHLCLGANFFVFGG